MPRVIKSSKWFSKGPGTALLGTRSANHRTQCPQNTALGEVGRKLWQKLRHTCSIILSVPSKPWRSMEAF